ncbi:cadherin repeat domain-containing protein, partial [Microvirga roseola]|uniref:cadherin repeat domain-containing protein n=1 Tax=Microvirga roseola TaxID=2883126 RepID=UPI001E5A21BD
ASVAFYLNQRVLSLEGGGGNDMPDGGTGRNNMAVFSGDRAEYTITGNPDESFTIVHAHGSRADGTDELKNIRLVKFSDQTIALTNANPSSLYLSKISVSEGAQVGADMGDVSGYDSDGDALTYSFVSNPGDFFGLDSSGRGLILNRALDYESATQHTISIKAQDPYGGELVKTFTISMSTMSSRRRRWSVAGRRAPNSCRASRARTGSTA